MSAIGRRAFLAGPWRHEPGLRITALTLRGNDDLLVTTNLGLTGFGYWSGEDDLHRLRTQWIGRPPGDSETLDAPASAGAEIALWDLAAQAARVPLYRLLGGKCRETVECRRGGDGVHLGSIHAMQRGARPAWLAAVRHRAVFQASLHCAAAWEDCAGLTGAARAGRLPVPEGIGL